MLRPIRLSQRLGTWRRTRQVARAHQRRLLVQGNRVVLAACVLFACACLVLGLRPQDQNQEPDGFPPNTGQTVLAPGERGAGGTGTEAQVPFAPALCNPFDSSCLGDTLASWAASRLQSAFQPLADALLQNPADIIYQTPPEDSYQNRTILAINALLVGVVDAALASLFVIGAYNLMVGQHLSLFHTSFSELLSRAILVVGAVHFNLFFLSLFIQFENELSLAVIHAASYTMLTNVLKGLFSNPITGLIVFVLVLVLGIMVVLLLIQMVVRIALVAVCLALAPLGLGCLLLPQSMRWGRLWLTTLSSAVLVQLLQVIALGLAGTFVTAIASTSLIRLDRELAALFLAIGTMGLVLKIPGMLQSWALHPMLEGGGGTNDSTSTQEARSGGGGGSGGGDIGDIAWGETFGGGGGGWSSGWGGGWSGAMGGSPVMEGTVVSEESGAMLLLF